ncbi:hypothetical protein H257_15458 [Aphanomyces astaci]|uniref:Uncharacterized protein n=1 Tax=Aphanomyces astaci TaxID=112090 RepID=W4FMB3_APHAT|nr:hypothetical protein H257_15458 [Aphanomyces astaci]ETV68652.1 hypothetical protein H257_15458 [Aphanomyces astaci]|eukprot:XP_009841877.1 hypothetical protein H257_15458 [Aphanomyces astaci]
MLNVNIREAEDDEDYSWYLESYSVVVGSREYLALNQKLVKMISLLHYVVQYSQTCFRESQRQEAALWIHENINPFAPPLEVRINYAFAMLSTRSSPMLNAIPSTRCFWNEA